jgi:putative hydrolase of the HAD superfamily
MTGIRAVWTDFGGVLTPPIAEDTAAYCRRLDLPPKDFLAAMRAIGDSYGTDPMAPLDTPLLTVEEWSERMEEILRAEHGHTVDLSNFSEQWFTDRETNKRWLVRLERLKADGYFVGLLSNMVPAWDSYWRRMVPIELFDDLVLSFRVGCRKPEPEVFQLAQEHAGQPAQACLLVDDSAANCEGATAAGWQAIHFTDTGTAIDQLDNLLADPAPREEEHEPHGSHPHLRGT